MGVILQQRQFLVIHGNAIRFADKCVVFAGPSGIGKSTLAAAFHKRGYEILADDVCAIDSNGNVVPSFPQLKLWQDAAEKLAIDTTNLQQVEREVTKYAIPLPQTSWASLPVAAVYILTSDERTEFKISTIDGINKFIALAENTYRMEYLDGLGLKTEHLHQCTKLAGKILMAQITRPAHGFRLNALLDFILEDLLDSGISAS